MQLRNREIIPHSSCTKHASTPTRARFFYAYDHKDDFGPVSASCIFKQHNLEPRTAYRWLKDRHEIGTIMERRSDGRKEKKLILGRERSGRPYKIPDFQLRHLLQSDQKNRTKKLETQLSEAGIQVSKRTLQRSLKDRCNAGMFKASTQSSITGPQAVQRKEYTHSNLHKPIEGYWDGILWTDEAHMSLQDFPASWILRVIGTRNDPENIVQHHPITQNVVHFAAWINYYAMADELTFYNDEYDDFIAPAPTPKPRRRPTTETEEEFHHRMLQWEAEKARTPEIKKPGNSMRASYYTEKILPIYNAAYWSLKARSDQLRPHVAPQLRYTWWLQEDNDPSHGTRNHDSLPAEYKRQHGILTFKHPANSPDLNPIEGLWNIIKERVKQYLDSINSITELKEALQREWKEIQLNEVQQRIMEMPARVRQVHNFPYVRAKGETW